MFSDTSDQIWKKNHVLELFKWHNQRFSVWLLSDKSIYEITYVTDPKYVLA